MNATSPIPAAPTTAPAPTEAAAKEASDMSLEGLQSVPDTDALAEPPAIAAQLARELPDFGDVHWVAEIGSTNAHLLARARARHANERPLPWLLGTHVQTEGRGRAGRTWQNQPGTCLMMSVALAVDMPSHRLPALSPLSGLAACEALRALAGPRAHDIKVKWPNDVQFGEKKLGGILVETMRAPDGSGHIVVIGMGLNLARAAHLSQDLARGVADWSEVLTSADPNPPAVSLASDPLALANITAALAKSWREVVAQCCVQGFAGLRDRYESVDALLGRPVNVLERGEILFQGTAESYDQDGRLMVRTQDQGLCPVSVGDVSIRPQAIQGDA